MKSIVEGNRKGTCWLCGLEGPTEEHHIFGGTRNRKLSGRYGLTVYLCPPLPPGQPGGGPCR